MNRDHWLVDKTGDEAYRSKFLLTCTTLETSSAYIDTAPIATVPSGAAAARVTTVWITGTAENIIVVLLTISIPLGICGW